MRTTKLIAAIAALLVAVSMAFVATGSPASHAMAKEKHDLVAKGKEIGTSNKFKLFGKVSTFKGRNIIIQRKVNKQSYKFWKKTKTSADKGTFNERIFGGKRGDKVCYKVVVPSTKQYKKTSLVIGCITTF